MRVDAHQHFWTYDPREYGWIDGSMAALRRDFGPADLEPELLRAGFDACVAVQTRQTLAETEFLLAHADRHPFVIGVVGWVDLRSPTVAQELARFAAHPRFVGVRHIVQAEPDDFLLRPEVVRGVSQLARFDLAYDILVYPRQLAAAAALAERLPAQRFVLDHLGKPDIRSGEIESWSRALRRLAACPNVSAKLSGLVTEADWHAWRPASLRPYLDVAFELFGAERLIVGSDWPVCLVAGDYARVTGALTEYLDGRSVADRAAVLGENAVRFWKLRPRGAGQEEAR